MKRLAKSSVLLLVSLAVVASAGFIGYNLGAHRQYTYFIDHSGSSQGCIPSDKWPCWKMDRHECLWFANSTAIVQYCSSGQGGWDLCDPALNATYLPCNSKEAK